MSENDRVDEACDKYSKGVSLLIDKVLTNSTSYNMEIFRNDVTILQQDLKHATKWNQLEIDHFHQTCVKDQKSNVAMLFKGRSKKLTADVFSSRDWVRGLKVCYAPSMHKYMVDTLFLIPSLL